MKTINPLNNPLFPEPDKPAQDSNPAAHLIRQKIEGMYEHEPSAKQELAEAEHVKHRSKHQQFMHQLNTSGQSLAAIQTAWHQYYTDLPAKEKHEVWQEFYFNYAQASQQTTKPAAQITMSLPQPTPTVEAPDRTTMPRFAMPTTTSTPADIKQQLLKRVRGRAKTKRGSHFQSLIFGLSMGTLTTLILLFGFFNERFIAPFITPSRSVSATPIIIDPSSTAVGPEPKLIIPKINVEIPVVFDEPSIEEKALQRALEGGVVHYATTPNPGELGNGVIFGHSSNNLLNKGKYKFAFVSLKHLEIGDTFMVQKDGKRYVYRVYEKKIVKPTEVGVLGSTAKPATMTLITCDPPGTALNRLVVIGEQISPDPAKDAASTAKPAAKQQPTVLPSNAPSLWSRIFGN